MLLRDESSLERLSYLDQDAIKQLVECDSMKSTLELAKNLQPLENKIEKVSKVNTLVPYILSKENKKYYISTAKSLLSRQKKKDPFFLEYHNG